MLYANTSGNLVTDTLPYQETDRSVMRDAPTETHISVKESYSITFTTHRPQMAVNSSKVKFGFRKLDWIMIIA